MPERLGQHFLKNPVVLRSIAKLVNPEAQDTIIEIGPGHGELTDKLKAISYKLKAVKIVAIEKDPWLAEVLAKKFAADKNIEIIHGDALKILPNLTNNPPPTTDNHQLKAGSFKLVGNIPYYITGRLLRILGKLTPRPKKIILMIQKEVAERITAKPPKMNLLAAIIQSWSSPVIRRHVPRGDFQPLPRVDSAILELIPNQESKPVADSEAFNTFLRTVFKQPRKTLVNNLTAEGLIDKPAVEKVLVSLGFDLSIRPQNLSLENLARLKELL
jgi:16S rRNA (adenine1518-N6/adenine1519-N6)-dimethyltransferase